MYCGRRYRVCAGAPRPDPAFSRRRVFPFARRRRVAFVVPVTDAAKVMGKALVATPERLQEADADL